MTRGSCVLGQISASLGLSLLLRGLDYMFSELLPAQSFRVMIS